MNGQMKWYLKETLEEDGSIRIRITDANDNYYTLHEYLCIRYNIEINPYTERCYGNVLSADIPKNTPQFYTYALAIEYFTRVLLQERKDIEATLEIVELL